MTWSFWWMILIFWKMTCIILGDDLHFWSLICFFFGWWLAFFGQWLAFFGRKFAIFWPMTSIYIWWLISISWSLSCVFYYDDLHFLFGDFSLLVRKIITLWLVYYFRRLYRQSQVMPVRTGNCFEIFGLCYPWLY